jgi:hypothetical protein
MNDTHGYIGFKGNVHFAGIDAYGEVIDFTIHNIFTDIGRTIAAKRLGDSGEELVHTIALGDDATAAAVTQTALIGNMVGYNTSTTWSNITTSVTLDTSKWVAVVPVTSAATVREAALSQSSDGLNVTGMVARVVVSPVIVMPANSALTVTWTLQCT